VVAYLLDTNVLSASRRLRGNEGVHAWMDATPGEDMRISVLTLGEIAKGIALVARRDAAASSSLGSWFADVRLAFAGRTLTIDGSIAETWGNLAAVRTLPVVDGLLAATAIVHGLTLVTRNARDVAGTGVAVLDPWHG
jgi:toxin FitB